jgi:anti-sigma B factor antagonist
VTTASKSPANGGSGRSAADPGTTRRDPDLDGWFPEPRRGQTENTSGSATCGGTPRSDAFAVSSERHEHSQRLRPAGDLDIATAPTLERELEAAAAGDAEVIVLDLRQLTFMDSSGIHLLLRANETWGAREKRLRILTGPPLIDRVFDLARVRELLPIVAGDEDQRTDHARARRGNSPPPC